jgi:hypothetical protein
MSWSKNPKDVFYKYMYNGKYSTSEKSLETTSNYNDLLYHVTSVKLNHLTNHDDLVIDIVLIGYDWVNNRPAIFSVNPNDFKTVFNNDSNLSKFKTSLNTIQDRPDPLINTPTPINGWVTDAKNLKKLNSIIKTEYGAVASNVQNAKDSGIVDVANMWCYNDFAYAGMPINISEKCSRFFTLYYSADIPNVYAQHGYRFPNGLNPNAPQNWLITSQTSDNKLYSCFKVMYLTLNDWLINFSGRDDDGTLALKNSKYELPNIKYLAENSTNYYAQHPQIFLSNCITTNNRLYSGQALYSNDLKYKAYLDINGSLDVYKLPLTESNMNPKRSAYSSNTTLNKNSYQKFYLIPQLDGNLVLYKVGELDNISKDKSVWATGTNDAFSNNSELKLVLEAGGILIAYIAGVAATKFNKPTNPPAQVPTKNVYQPLIKSDKVASTLKKIDNIHSNSKVVATTKYNGINLKTANGRFDPQCTHYWYDSDDKNAKLINDISNQKCYINPRLQYQFKNNIVSHKYTKFQTMVWIDGDYNNLNFDYVYEYRNGLFKSYFTKFPDKLQNSLIQYCAKGERWVHGDCSKLAITTGKSNIQNSLSSLIDYDITNRICVNPSADAKNFCEYIAPSHNILKKLITRNSEFRSLNPVANINSYKYVSNDKLDIVNKYILKYQDYSEDELLFLQQFYNTDKGMQFYTNWLTAYSKCIKVSIPKLYKIPDYNLSQAPDYYGIYAYYIIFKTKDQLQLAVSNYDINSLSIIGSETKAGNKTYKISDPLWKGLTVSITNKLFNYQNLQPFTTKDIDSKFSQAELYLFDKAYDKQVWNLLDYDGKSIVPIYVLKIKSTKLHFTTTHEAMKIPININTNNHHGKEKLDSKHAYNDNEICSQNPDWCFDEYNKYVSNPDNYASTQYNNICDKLLFSSDHKNTIQKSCANTFGIINAKNPEYRYSNKSASSVRSIETDYQPLWESVGCTTNLKQQPAGSSFSDPKKYSDKDYWNASSFSEITTDMLQWASLSTPDQKTVCKGNPRPPNTYQSMFNKLGCSIDINTIAAGSSHTDSSKYGIKDLWDAQDLDAVTNDMKLWKNNNPEQCYGTNINYNDQKLLWQAAGCTTDISNVAIGSSSKTSDMYALKDKWNGKSSKYIHDDILAVASSKDSNNQAMCYGKAKFGNYEGFSGGSVVSLCEDPNISKEIQAACDKGAIAYCKQGANIFNANCKPFIVKFPELKKYNDEYCANNLLDNKNCNHQDATKPLPPSPTPTPLNKSVDISTTKSTPTPLNKPVNISTTKPTQVMPPQDIDPSSKYLFLAYDDTGNIVWNNSPKSDVEWMAKTSVKNKSYKELNGPIGIEMYSDAPIFKTFKDTTTSGSTKMNSFGSVGLNSIAAVIAIPDNYVIGYSLNKPNAYLYREQRSGKDFIFKVFKKNKIKIPSVNPPNEVDPASKYLFLTYNKNGKIVWNNSPKSDIEWIAKHGAKNMNYQYSNNSSPKGVEFSKDAAIFKYFADKTPGGSDDWNSYGVSGLNSATTVMDIDHDYVNGFTVDREHPYLYREQLGKDYIFKVFKKINKDPNPIKLQKNQDKINYFFLTYNSSGDIVMNSITDDKVWETKQDTKTPLYSYKDGPPGVELKSNAKLFTYFKKGSDAQINNSYGNSGVNSISTVVNIPDDILVGFSPDYKNQYVYRNQNGQDFIYKVYKRDTHISKFTNVKESFSQYTTDWLFIVVSFILFILIIFCIIKWKRNRNIKIHSLIVPNHIDTQNSV